MRFLCIDLVNVGYTINIMSILLNLVVTTYAIYK